jgi:hypothetical protein
MRQRFFYRFLLRFAYLSLQVRRGGRPNNAERFGAEKVKS